MFKIFRIMKKYIKETRTFKLLMLEHAIQKNILKKYDNFLLDLDNVKINLKQLKTLVNDLKIEITNLKIYNIKLIKKFGDLDMYVCDYSNIANSIINKIIDFLEKIKNPKFDEIIFPEGDVIKHNLFPKIEIETNNFNRIHIIDLPMILRGIGVGKTIYKSIIEKIEFISSIEIDRTQDAELVWNSIINEKSVYSFVCDKKIISISQNMKYEKILNIIKDFFHYELENKFPVILDEDFKNKFNIKAELLNEI